MAAANIVGEVFFELLVFRPGSDPARAQNLLYGRNFLIADTGAGEGEKSLTHGEPQGVGSPSAKGPKETEFQWFSNLSGTNRI
jgi:hypothetical protein